MRAKEFMTLLTEGPAGIDWSAPSPENYTNLKPYSPAGAGSQPVSGQVKVMPQLPDIPGSFADTANAVPGNPEAGVKPRMSVRAATGPVAPPETPAGSKLPPLGDTPNLGQSKPQGRIQPPNLEMPPKPTGGSTPTFNNPSLPPDFSAGPNPKTQPRSGTLSWPEMKDELKNLGGDIAKGLAGAALKGTRLASVPGIIGSVFEPTDLNTGEEEFLRQRARDEEESRRQQGVNAFNKAKVFDPNNPD
jgi:hypothetical protein